MTHAPPNQPVFVCSPDVAESMRARGIDPGMPIVESNLLAPGTWAVMSEPTRDAEPTAPWLECWAGRDLL